MHRLVRALGWLALGVIGLTTAAVVALAIYTRTESFRRWFEPRALAAINDSIRGTVSWQRLEGSIWGGVRLVNLQLRYRDRVLFSAASTELDYSLVPLLWKQIRITRLAASQPVLDLRKQPDGEWNLVEALSSGEAATEEPFPWTIVIAGIALTGGDLALRPVAGADDLYRLRQLDAGGRVRIAEGFNATVERLAAWVEMPQTPALYASGGLSYRQSEQAQSLAFDKLWLQSARSRVMLAGAVKNFANLESDLRLQIDRLAAADIQRYVAQWPSDIAVTGAASARGPGSALDAKFDLRLAGAELAGTARADLVSERKPFSANLALRKLPLGQIFQSSGITGMMNAEVKLAGAAATSETLSGSGTAQLEGLVVQGRAAGRASLQGSWRGELADVALTINGPLGQGNGRGQIRFADLPRYQADLSMRGLNVAGLLQLKDAPAGRLSFEARFSGTGLELATMNSRATVDLLASQLDQVSIQSGKISARIAGGLLQLDDLRLQAPGASLSAEGVLGIAAPQSGRLNYRLQAADLTPWLDLLARKGSGQLRLSGRAEGNLTRLRTIGSAHLRDLKLAEGSLRGARIDFALERVEGQSLPSGAIKLEASGLDAAVDLARLGAAIELPAAPAHAIGVRADGRDGAGSAYRLVAAIENRPGELLVNVRELSVPFADKGWQLAEPATLTKRGDDFFVDRLRLQSGGAQLIAAGRFSLVGAQGFSLRADGIQPAMLGGFLPQAAQSSGALSAQVQVGGSAAQPEITAVAEVGAGQIAGQPYQMLRARADYRRQRIGLEMTIDQDSTHSLQVRGTIPFALAWAPAWRADAWPGMELRVRTAGLSLAFLNALKLPLENISGQVTLDLLITGSLTEPQAGGGFQVIDGAFAVRDLGIRVSNVGVAGRADEQRLLLTGLSARSNGGTLSGSGVVALKQFTPHEFNLELTARRWPAIATERYQATIDADLKAGGALTSPRVGGQVRLIAGTIRPSVNLLEKSSVSLERDPTIVVVRRRGGPPIAPKANGNGRGAGESNDLWNALALDLTVAIPNNLWIRHPNANVELSGKLEVDKAARQELTLLGPIEVVRGWAGFQGRRFEISRGLVQFTGAQPIDPVITIVGQHVVNDYRVSAVVSGRASKPTLELQSQPQVEQADILSLLLFGRTTGELSGGEQLSLQKSAIDIGAGFAAAQLGKAVSGALGLDALGVDLSELTFSGGAARFGRYLGGRTYFSVSQDIAGDNGQEVSLEYRLTPNILIDATSSSSGNSGVDVIWHKRY